MLQPIENPREMDLALAELLKRLGVDPSYRTACATAFAEGLTEANAARAASYMHDGSLTTIEQVVEV